MKGCVNMNINKPCLTLLTSHYPCLISGDFFEDSIPYLQQNFDIRIISTDTQNDQTRSLPKNVVFTRMPEQTKANFHRTKIPVLFNSLFWEIIDNCKRLNGLTWPIFKRVLSVMSKSYHLAKYLADQEEFDSKAPILYYSFVSSEYIFAPILAKRYAKKNIKSIIRCRGIDIERFEKDICAKAFMLAADKHSDSLYFDCDDRKRYFMKHYANKPTNPYRYMVVRFGTDDHVDINSEMKTDDTLHILTRTPQDSDISIHKFLKALSKVETNKKIKWTHIGDPKPFEEDAKVLLSLNPNISYTFPGELSYTKRLEYYSNNYIDCFFYLSSMRSLPFEIVEAMSCSIFPLASDIGGINELVTNSNGVLIPEDISRNELTSVIEVLAKIDAESLREKCILARKTFLQYCTAERNCCAITEHFFQVLAE